MAKKKVNNTDVSTDTKQLETNKFVSKTNDKVKTNEDVNDVNVTFEKKKKMLRDLSYSDLLCLEYFCSKLCKRFETTARLDYKGQVLFKEYQRYYDMIFNEIKERVSSCCSNAND